MLDWCLVRDYAGNVSWIMINCLFVFVFGIGISGIESILSQQEVYIIQFS